LFTVITGLARHGFPGLLKRVNFSAMSQWHTAFAPATVANVGPGYDVLGLALDPLLKLGDTCDVRLAPVGQLQLSIDGDGGRLPTDPDANVATVAARVVLARAGASQSTGLQLRLHKGLPLGSGLGSSAASAASAALATNLALGSPLTRAQLFDAGRAGEAIAAGVPHPDNVVPSLAGGFLAMVDDGSQLHVARLPVPESLRVAIVIPELEVRTADARAVLPAHVERSDAIANVGRVALLVSALYEGDLERLGLGLHDRLHQPWRTPLVRGFDAVRDAGMAAGAIGVGLSGSGPAMFAFAHRDRAETVAQSMAEAFQKQGIGARSIHGAVSQPFV
jgi:homoserine kinase